MSQKALILEDRSAAYIEVHEQRTAGNQWFITWHSLNLAKRQFSQQQIVLLG